MLDLCRQVFEDGTLGVSPARDVSLRTGLFAYQVARGMTELRDKGVIEPVTVRGRDGARRPDRSAPGQVMGIVIDEYVNHVLKAGRAAA